MTRTLKRTLFEAAGILAIAVAGIGAARTNANAASTTTHTTLTKQQKASKAKQEKKTQSKNYQQYSKRLQKDQTQLLADKNKAKETGTAGANVAKRMVPKDQAKVQKDKTMLPASEQKKALAKVHKPAVQKPVKKPAKRNPVKKNKSLIHKPAKPQAAAKQTAKQKAAQKDARGEASNAMGKKDPTPLKSNAKPNYAQGKKSLPKTLEKSPATYITMGAGLVMVLAGGTYYLKHRAKN